MKKSQSNRLYKVVLRCPDGAFKKFPVAYPRQLDASGGRTRHIILDWSTMNLHTTDGSYLMVDAIVQENS